ncbi:MAG: putative sulfate exporter family transporter, partial [Planctomycetales bacterium]|nr:putative sulfate exporter family transporter [Planctomycetales bacterium]
MQHDHSYDGEVGQGEVIDSVSSPPPVSQPRGLLTEDLAAIAVAVILLVACCLAVRSNQSEPAADSSASVTYENSLKPWLGMPAEWQGNPLQALGGPSELTRVVGAGVILWIVFALGAGAIGRNIGRVAMAFPIVFLLATLAYVIAENAVVSAYSLEYALWAIIVGLLISNTIGTPRWLRAGVMTEFYIKTGLVIMGAEVLFNKLLALSEKGIVVSWLVTPTVLVATFWFGQRVLRMKSASLNMVISADMSVCGVSAAIATAAACKAKKEELSLAISMSLMFTVAMMVVMPPIIRLLGLSEAVGGAWMGGTIDSTGAVAAAGALLGDEAEKVAIAVKMIQNILIGVVAFFVALYWVTYVEKNPDDRPNIGEVWRRFPKFVLGFVLASIVFSIIYSFPSGDGYVNAVVKGASKSIRGWRFCLAFVSIDLDT